MIQDAARRRAAGALNYWTRLLPPELALSGRSEVTVRIIEWANYDRRGSRRPPGRTRVRIDLAWPGETA